MKKKSLFLGLAFFALSSSHLLCAQEVSKTAVEVQSNSHLDVEGWLPSGPSVFPQLKADPRQPRCSIAYRLDDEALRSDIGMVNLAANLFLWRGFDIWNFDEVDVCFTGAVWANYDMRAFSMDLMNSDWTASLPVSAKMGDTQMRARLYHISCHQGDEFLQRPGEILNRKNPSYEVLELSAYTPLYEDRLYGYGTLAHIIHSDSSFPMKRFYFELGAEYYMKDANFMAGSLEAAPYAAVHGRFWEYESYEPSYNVALGLSWKNVNRSKPVLDTSIEYYHGHSLEGQFALYKTDYVYFQLTYRP